MDQFFGVLDDLYVTCFELAALYHVSTEQDPRKQAALLATPQQPSEVQRPRIQRNGSGSLTLDLIKTGDPAAALAQTALGLLSLALSKPDVIVTLPDRIRSLVAAEREREVKAARHGSKIDLADVGRRGANSTLAASFIEGLLPKIEESAQRLLELSGGRITVDPIPEVEGGGETLI